MWGDLQPGVARDGCTVLPTPGFGMQRFQRKDRSTTRCLSPRILNGVVGKGHSALLVETHGGLPIANSATSKGSCDGYVARG